MAPKLKIGAGSITLNANKARLRIHIDMANAEESGKGDSYSRLKLLKRSIAGIQVKGLAKVDRGVIVKDDAPKVLAANGGLPVNRLLVTGYGLKEVMGTDGASPLPLPFNTHLTRLLKPYDGYRGIHKLTVQVWTVSRQNRTTSWRPPSCSVSKLPDKPSTTRSNIRCSRTA